MVGISSATVGWMYVHGAADHGVGSAGTREWWHEGALARVSEEPPRRQTGPRQPRGVAGITRGPVSSSTAPTSAVSRARKQSGG